MTYYRELQPTIIEGIVDSFGVDTGDVAVCVEQILAAQVPAEPDYEAAKMVAQAILNEALPDGRWMAINAHMIVDAALGIGDTE